MWVYTCCFLLVSTYLYRYGLCFLFLLICCCLCWECSAPSRGEGNSKHWLAQIYGKYLPTDHTGKKTLHRTKKTPPIVVDFILRKSSYSFPLVLQISWPKHELVLVWNAWVSSWSRQEKLETICIQFSTQWTSGLRCVTRCVMPSRWTCRHKQPTRSLCSRSSLQ